MNSIEHKSNPFKTALTICLGFLVIYLIYNYSWALWVSIAVGGFSLLSTFLAKKIEQVWFGIAYVLSLIIPNILMSIVFYFILFPMSLLRRLFSKGDPMGFKGKTKKSMFITRSESFSSSSFENPW